MTGDQSPVGAVPGWKGILPLLRKEWLVFDLRGRISVFGIFLLAAVQVIYVDELYLLLGLALAAALAVYVPVVEWYQEADPMLHSLPIHRDTVVVARYLVAVLAGTVAGVVWSAAGRILLPLLDAGRENPALWMTLEGGLTFVVALGLMAAVFFPLYFRLGLGRGAVAFLMLSIAVLFLAYGTAGLGGDAGNGLAAGSPGHAPGPVPSFGGFPQVPPSALVRARISGLMGSLGVSGTLAFILVFLAVIFYASIRLSRRWYREREF
jgi:hypothetical protein